MSTWPTARLEKLGTQRASLGNYANMFVYTRDYENLLKTNCGNLRHRPGDPKKLLCSSKSAPVCQHEVLKKKILSYSEVMREWDETTRKIRWMSLPLDPVPRGLWWEGERVWAEKREDGKPKRGPTGNLKLCTGKRAWLSLPERTLRDGKWNERSLLEGTKKRPVFHHESMFIK